jgi:hypothetical protein
MFVWPLDFDATTKLLFPLIVALLLYFVHRMFEGKPRIIYCVFRAASDPPPEPALRQYFSPARRTHRLRNRPSSIQTHSWSRARERRLRKDVRVNHGLFPLSYQTFPPVTPKIEHGQRGSTDIYIPVLVSGRTGDDLRVSTVRRLSLSLMT